MRWQVVAVHQKPQKEFITVCVSATMPFRVACNTLQRRGRTNGCTQQQYRCQRTPSKRHGSNQRSVATPSPRTQPHPVLLTCSPNTKFRGSGRRLEDGQVERLRFLASDSCEHATRRVWPYCAVMQEPPQGLSWTRSQRREEHLRFNASNASDCGEGGYRSAGGQSKRSNSSNSNRVTSNQVAGYESAEFCRIRSFHVSNGRSGQKSGWLERSVRRHNGRFFSLRPCSERAPLQRRPLSAVIRRLQTGQRRRIGYDVW